MGLGRFVDVERHPRQEHKPWTIVKTRGYFKVLPIYPRFTLLAWIVSKRALIYEPNETRKEKVFYGSWPPCRCETNYTQWGKEPLYMNQKRCAKRRYSMGLGHLVDVERHTVSKRALYTYQKSPIYDPQEPYIYSKRALYIGNVS